MLAHVSDDAANTSGTDAWLGRVLASQFHIVERLGAGGMGAVYRAKQLEMDRDVVVKVMHAALNANEDSAGRFKREARSVARLNHPHIVQIHVFGTTDDGVRFLAMEYVDGEPLGSVIERGPMPQARVLRIADQVCAALAEAHANGIVHRDLKPDNVMLSDRLGNADYVTVLDFGIAKLTDEGAMQGGFQTQSGMITGTPRYMSPEQARALGVDGRADLYSLGVMLYEMLTGEHPYKADSALDYLVKHATAPIPRATDRFQHLGLMPRVEAIVTRCLQKDPTQRYQSALELQRELREALRDLPDGLRPFPTPRTPPAHAPAPRPRAGTGGASPALVAALISFVVLVIAGGVIAAVLLSGDVEAPTPTTPAAEADPREKPEAPEDPPSDPPPEGGLALSVGEPIGGLLVPAGATLFADAPQALTLKTTASPGDVLDFYVHHLSAEWEGVAERANGVSIDDKGSPITHVSVSVLADGTMISLVRNARLAKPQVAEAGEGPFGEPVFPGSIIASRSNSHVQYSVDAPFDQVADYFVEALRGMDGLTMHRNPASTGKPILAVSVTSADLRYTSLSVMPDPQSVDGKRLMVVIAAKP